MPVGELGAGARDLPCTLKANLVAHSMMDLKTRSSRISGHEFDDCSKLGMFEPDRCWPYNHDLAASGFAPWHRRLGGHREGAERIVGGGEDWWGRYDRLKGKKRERQLSKAQWT